MIPTHAGRDLNTIINKLLEVNWKKLASEINMSEGVIREIDEGCTRELLKDRPYCCRKELILKYCYSEGLGVAEIACKIADALESDNIGYKGLAQELREKFPAKNIVTSNSITGTL